MIHILEEKPSYLQTDRSLSRWLSKCNTIALSHQIFLTAYFLIIESITLLTLMIYLFLLKVTNYLFLVIIVKNKGGQEILIK